MGKMTVVIRLLRSISWSSLASVSRAAAWGIYLNAQPSTVTLTLSLPHMALFWCLQPPLLALVVMLSCCYSFLHNIWNEKSTLSSVHIIQCVSERANFTSSLRSIQLTAVSLHYSDYSSYCLIGRLVITDHKGYSFFIMYSITFSQDLTNQHRFTQTDGLIYKAKFCLCLLMKGILIMHTLLSNTPVQ